MHIRIALVCNKACAAARGSGCMAPQNIMNFRPSEIVSETILCLMPFFFLMTLGAAAVAPAALTPTALHCKYEYDNCPQKGVSKATMKPPWIHH